MLKKTLRLFLFLGFILILTNCQNDAATQKETQAQEQILEDKLATAKIEFKEALNKKENPVLEIVNSYQNKSPFMEEDLKLGYKRMIERFELFKAGKLSEEAYYEDINGAFEEDAPFKTDIAERISQYYAKKFREKVIRHDEAYETYINIQQTKKEINDLKKIATDE